MKKMKKEFVHQDVHVTLRLRGQFTVIDGDNKNDEAFFINLISDYTKKNPDSNIIFLNYENTKDVDFEAFKDRMRCLRQHIIIVDQADEVFKRTEIRDYLLHDGYNCYMLMSKTFATKLQQIAEIAIDTKEGNKNLDIIYVAENLDLMKLFR